MERLERVREKLRRDSAEMIERMKAKLVPIDFKSIEQHDRSYLANLYRLNKQRATVDRHVYTSKTYDRVREEFFQQRLSRGDPAEDKAQRAKLYSEKLKLVHQLDPPHPQPATSEPRLYGRFDREWHKKLHEQEEALSHHKSVLDVGNRYLALSKAAKKKPGDAGPVPPPGDPEPKPAENKGLEYLRHARSMAKKREALDEDEIVSIRRKIEQLQET